MIYLVGKIMTPLLIRKTIFPPFLLATLSSWLLTLILTRSLLTEIQLPGVEVPGHCQEQLMTTLVLMLFDFNNFLHWTKNGGGHGPSGPLPGSPLIWSERGAILEMR